MSEYIGESFRVLVSDGLHLPTGHVAAGELFTFTEQHAAYGLGPDLWLKCGQVEATSAASYPPKKDKSAPPVEVPAEVAPIEDAPPVPDVGTEDGADEAEAVEVDPFELVGRTVTRSGRHHGNNARP